MHKFWKLISGAPLFGTPEEVTDYICKHWSVFSQKSFSFMAFKLWSVTLIFCSNITLVRYKSNDQSQKGKQTMAWSRYEQLINGEGGKFSKN